MTDFLQLFFSGLATGSIYALAALGFTLLWQASGTINCARGEFVMLPTFMSLGAPMLVLHKKASELLADPNIERLFLGGGHLPGAAATAAVPASQAGAPRKP
ncbi:MAG: amino acid/amide transporter rane protein 1, family [Paucimonas sp.]|nr:amino acid/amide transporter rane protein 1, family [Paucimonas sp.]